MIYGGELGFILLIMLGQGNRGNVKVPGRKDPTWQVWFVFTGFVLFHKVWFVLQGSWAVLRAPLDEESGEGEPLIVAVIFCENPFL